MMDEKDKQQLRKAEEQIHRAEKVMFTILGREITRRMLVVKGVVTGSLLVQLTHPELAILATVVGGMIWLWVEA
jgi:hypothetical protein